MPVTPPVARPVAREEFLALGRRVSGVALAEADGEALVGDEDELVGAGGEHGADDGLSPSARLMPMRPPSRVAFVVGESELFLMTPDLVAMTRKRSVDEVLHAEHGGDLLALG
jgi:hypothetical protein